MMICIIRVHTCITINVLRRLNLSAATPPISPNISIGIARATRTDATEVVDPVRSQTSQLRATMSACMAVADRTCPNHKYRKLRFLRDLDAAERVAGINPEIASGTRPDLLPVRYSIPMQYMPAILQGSVIVDE